MFGYGFLPCRWKSHAVNTSSGADNNRLIAPKQQIETLLFHRRMKAAYYRYAGVTQCPRQIVYSKNYLPRTFGGAEEAKQGIFENFEIAKRSKPGWHSIRRHVVQAGWVARIGEVEQKSFIRAVSDVILHGRQSVAS